MCNSFHAKAEMPAQNRFERSRLLLMSLRRGVAQIVRLLALNSQRAGGRAVLHTSVMTQPSSVGLLLGCRASFSALLIALVIRRRVPVGMPADQYEHKSMNRPAG